MTKKGSVFKPKPQRVDEPSRTSDAWVEQGRRVEPQETTQKPTEAVEMKRLTIDIPADLHAEVKSKSARKGLKMADVIRGLLEAHFRTDWKD